MLNYRTPTPPFVLIFFSLPSNRSEEDKTVFIPGRDEEGREWNWTDLEDEVKVGFCPSLPFQSALWGPTQ